MREIILCMQMKEIYKWTFAPTELQDIRARHNFTRHIHSFIEIKFT